RLSDFCKHRHLTREAPGVVCTKRGLGTMEQAVQLRSSPRRPHHHVVQTFPVCSLMHGCDEEHHKSGLHAHRAITNDRGSRGGWRTVACTSGLLVVFCRKETPSW